MVKKSLFGSQPSTIIFSAVLLAAVITISVGQHLKAQYDESYCQGKKDEMMSRAAEWGGRWENATNDPNGQIRADGKKLTSEMGLTLANCDTSLSDHDKLTLTQMKDVINAEIDKNINYGPPCDPRCQPGPPIS